MSVQQPTESTRASPRQPTGCDPHRAVTTATTGGLDTNGKPMDLPDQIPSRDQVERVSKPQVHPNPGSFSTFTVVLLIAGAVAIGTLATVPW